MKKDRKLKKIADDFLSNYTDEEFLVKLKAEACNRQSDKKDNRINIKRFFAVCTSLLTMAVCLIITLVILFESNIINLSGKQDTDQVPETNNKFYSSENLIVNEISFEDFIKANTGVQLSEYNLDSIQKATDVFYNETLYYVARYNNLESLELLNLVVVVNPEYNYSNRVVNYECEANIGNYSVAYVETVSDEDGIYEINTTGEIKTEKLIIYIDYESVSLTAQSNFIYMLKSVLSL